MKFQLNRILLAVLAAFFTLAVLSPEARAHCDSYDGPVITDAKIALEKSDISPVLKWINADNEKEVREAFNKTIKLRAISPEVKEMADNYFFETLVRLHRAGEGFAYTGLKPAGTEVPHPIKAADMSLKNGSADMIIKHLTGDVEKQIRNKFDEVMEKMKSADVDAAHGREYVKAYVEYIHYVARLFDDINGEVSHKEE